MKWISILIAAGLSLAAAAGLAAQAFPTSQTEPQPVSPAQAIQAVRDFEGDPELPVKIVDYPSDSSRLIDIGRDYVMLCRGFVYHVGYRYPTIRREVPLLPDGSRSTTMPSPREAEIEPDRQSDISQSQAQGLALQYMADHFPAPPESMVLRESGCTGGLGSWQFQYDFTYYVDSGNGFTGPGVCTVVLDGRDGQVSQYIGDDFPLLVSTVPQLTPSQGISAAAQAIGYVADGTPTITWCGVLPPDSLGDEALFYDVSLPGYAYGAANDWETWYVRVDANTGSVLHEGVEAAIRPKSSVNLTALQAKAVREKVSLAYPRLVGRPIVMTMFGRKGFLDRPALMIESDPYVYLGYAVAAALGSDAMSAGGAINVTASGKRIAFRPGEADYTLNGRITALRHRPIYVAGAYYIPIELANEIAPGRFVYDAKAAAVDYQPSPASVGPNVRHE